MLDYGSQEFFSSDSIALGEPEYSVADTEAGIIRHSDNVVDRVVLMAVKVSMNLVQHYGKIFLGDSVPMHGGHVLFVLDITNLQPGRRAIPWIVHGSTYDTQHMCV